MTQITAFATDVLPNIYEFHLYTRSSVILYHPQEMQFRVQFRGWAPGFHTRLANPPTHALRPVKPNNACTLRITAAAGTKLAGAFLNGTVKLKSFPILAILSKQQNFTIQRTVIVHAALLVQGFPHWRIFLTAVSRRSLGRVSVPVWPINLSVRLRIVALVGHYPTNKLIHRRPISKRSFKGSFNPKITFGISSHF